MLLWNCILLLLVAGAALACDPQTQYRRADGQCCKKCGPGTRVAEMTLCLEPLCKPCADDEYQPEYTVKNQCELQPFCDPNKNLVHAGAVTPVELSPCRCREGYHCSSDACITCVVHSRCAPGQRARPPGNVLRDTVCQDCPPDTFSTEENTDSACRNWTVCEPESRTKTPGTTTSDAVCEPNPRSRALMIALILGFILIVVGLSIIAIYRGGKRRKENLKLLTENYRPVNVLPPNGHFLIAQPQDEEASLRGTPEENEDPQQPWGAQGTPRVSDRGRVVAQERGKSPVFSREESGQP